MTPLARSLLVLRALAWGMDVESACSSADAGAEAAAVPALLQTGQLRAAGIYVNETSDAGAPEGLPPPAGLPPPPTLRHGLVFIKNYKVGGSSFGGAVRRIGYRRGLAHARDDGWLTGEGPNEPGPPAVLAEHLPRKQIARDLATKMPGAFLATLIRDPVARCLSAFYFFRVSLKSTEPTEDAKVSYIKECSDRAQVDYTAVEPASAPSAVMASFDFVAVTERFDESLLVLAKKLNVSQVDVLYRRAKESGDSRFKGHVLVEHPPLSSEPKSVQEAAKRLLGDGPDAQMHALANRALDEAIASYGPGFGTEFAEFQRRLSLVEAECKDAGSCLWHDNGCGQACIDSLVKDRHWED